MTAATTPNTAPNRGDWAWPLKAPPCHLMPSPSPPLELQFLPPSSAASAAAAAAAPSPATRVPPASAWTVDPSRLQKLMMGSAVASSPPVPTPVPPIGSRSSLPDVGAFLDPGINKPLPSGWERCLDLKSGEVFIKKCDAVTDATGASPPAQFRHHFTQHNDWKQPCARPSRASEAIVQIDEQRPDWSIRWMQGKAVMPTQNLMTNTMNFIKTEKLYGEEERLSPPDRQPLCLDLDLRLTSDNRSRLASEAADVTPLQSSKPVLSASCSRDVPLTKVQPWKWQQLAHSSERPTTSIQEMVSESTMATAVCSKCLMYVLLKKSNPTCPRCFNPIILDCGVQCPSVKKRPRLELSPDDLSLSTDSSR